MMLAGGEANVQFARNAGLGEVSPIGYQRCHPKSLRQRFLCHLLGKGTTSDMLHFLCVSGYVRASCLLTDAGKRSNQGLRAQYPVRALHSLGSTWTAGTWISPGAVLS